MNINDTTISKKVKHDHRSSTERHECNITYRDKTITFIAGSPMNYDYGNGFNTLSGEVITKSGHRFHALLDLCPMDSGEHYGTGFIYNDKNGHVHLAFQRNPADMDAFIKSMSEQYGEEFEPFPYAYCYYTELAGDIHIDSDTGWANASSL